MAAVVRPVGVHHPQLGEGGIPQFLLKHILLEELQIRQIHGQAVGVQHLAQLLLTHVGEAVQHRHVLRHGVALPEGLRLIQGGLPALHRVDQVAPGLVQLLRGEGALEHIHRGGPDGGALPAGHHLDALGAGVGPLVVLPRQGLHRQQGVLPPGGGHLLVPQLVHLWLGQDGGAGGGVDGLVHPLHIVAAEHPHAGEAGEPQGVAELMEQPLRLHIVAGLLLYKTAKYVSHTLSPISLYEISHWSNW